MNARVALVTGASGDLGRAISLALADAGLHVVAVGRSREKLARLGERVHALAADLTIPSERALVVDHVAQGGRLDMLVLGSGIYARSDDPAALEQQLAANVLAPYALIRALLPFLVTAFGHVVFLNSTRGLSSAPPGIAQFAATQHALRTIADSLREEVNGRGVRVASLFLGRTATERQEAIFAVEGRPYVPDRLMQPTDVAGLVVGLLSLPSTAEVTDITVRPMLKS